MSTPVDTSLAGLKEITAQIVGIISSGQQILAGNAHMALTSQVTDLVAQVVWDYGKGPHIPGITLSCSKELIIGFDDLRLMKHAWRPKILTWEALGDHSFDLPVAVPPSVGPIPMDLPSPPIVTDNAASSSTNMTTKSWAMVKDKGKGKADLELEVDGSRKRKSPMMSALPSQPLKMVVESEDDEDPVIQPSGSGVPEVVLPLLSTIDSRTPRSPRSPQSPKKQTFGPVSCTVGSLQPPQAMSTVPVEAPPVFDAGDILIPGPLPPVALHKLQGQEDWCPLLVRIWEPHQSMFEASLPLTRRGQGLPPQLPPMFCPPHNQEPALAANLMAHLVLRLLSSSSFGSVLSSD
ncbi:hypothetical protein BD769DRAFT_1674381 [Suillus cothurnatus]|nr:hypothetical protein BD769DRAFT_1674381 [Suillus cothurnatus]